MTQIIQQNKSSLMNFRSLKTIFLAGSVSGILDAIAASVVFYINMGLMPGQVMQYVATGCYGPSAMIGGTYMICVGVFMHFLIAFSTAAIYFLVFPYLKMLSTMPVLSGLLLGIFVWLFMNLIVLPISQTPQQPFNATEALVEIVWHMFLVGLPVALITKRYFAAPGQVEN